MTESDDLRVTRGRPSCLSCHMPFADPDVVVLVFPPDDAAGERLTGAYHIPCYERTDTLGTHMTVIGSTGAKDPSAELQKQVDEFSDYVKARSLEEREELDDDELEERWPLVMKLIAQQRTRTYGSAN